MPPENMGSSGITIVLGEDDDGHATLITRNLERAGFEGKVVRRSDGEAVLEYFDELKKRDRHGIRQRLLILDINMPRLDGPGVLKRLREDPVFKQLPVIMLTTTDNPHEISRCYALGCNIYVTKPVVYEEFVEAISRLGNFLTIVRFPRDADPAE